MLILSQLVLFVFGIEVPLCRTSPWRDCGWIWVWTRYPFVGCQFPALEQELLLHSSSHVPSPGHDSFVLGPVIQACWQWSTSKPESDLFPKVALNVTQMCMINCQDVREGLLSASLWCWFWNRYVKTGLFNYSSLAEVPQNAEWTAIIILL